VPVRIGYLSGSATFESELFTRAFCGWSNVRLRIAVNFVGAPAVELPAAGSRPGPEATSTRRLDVAIPLGNGKLTGTLLLLWREPRHRVLSASE
jgi:hypothetical protein